jgi:hypothetical protein
VAEFGIPYSLVTPRGTLTFNASAPPTYALSGISGMDGGALRTGVDPTPTRDGATVRDAFREAAYPVLEGLIYAVATATQRRQYEDNLRGYTDSIRFNDGTLAWTPSGGTERYRTVRLFQPVTITGAWLKNFQLGLVSPDPLAYTNTLLTTDSGGLSGGFADVTVANGGNAPNFPILRIFGPITNPTVTNQTTGEVMSFTYSVANGRYLEVNCHPQAETVVLDTGTNLIDKAGMSSVFFAVAPGSTVLRLAGTSGGGATKLRVLHRDAWVG